MTAQEGSGLSLARRETRVATPDSPPRSPYRSVRDAHAEAVLTVNVVGLSGLIRHPSDVNLSPYSPPLPQIGTGARDPKSPNYSPASCSENFAIRHDLCDHSYTGGDSTVR
jgi:hypothetical protein